MIDIWFFVLFATASCCRFLFRLILNRKLFGEFRVFPHLCANVLSFLLFFFSLFVLFWFFRLRQKQKRKIRIFAVFAQKRTFLSQIKCLFSVIYDYIGQTTPHPPRFWHSQGGSALFRKFFIFLFFIFCKILWFCQFYFSTEFWEFLRISYLLFFLHKVS